MLGLTSPALPLTYPVLATDACGRFSGRNSVQLEIGLKAASASLSGTTRWSQLAGGRLSMRKTNQSPESCGPHTTAVLVA
jgi:hypothetical protein